MVFLGVFLGLRRATLGQGGLGVGCIQGDDHREALNAGERAGSMEQLREPSVGPLGTRGCPERRQAPGRVGTPTQTFPFPLQADLEPLVTVGASEVVPRVLSGESQNLCACSLRSFRLPGQKGLGLGDLSLANSGPGQPRVVGEGALEHKQGLWHSIRSPFPGVGTKCFRDAREAMTAGWSPSWRVQSLPRPGALSTGRVSRPAPCPTAHHSKQGPVHRGREGPLWMVPLGGTCPCACLGPGCGSAPRTGSPGHPCARHPN